MASASPRTRLRKAALYVGGALALALLLIEARVAPGFLEPPALLPSGEPQIDDTLARLPPGAELIEVRLDGGESLRGFFTPADDGAPVVLHLPESSGSAFSDFAPYHGLAWDLADAGFATLILDYRGVGASDGERSVDHLTADAIAMWHEALARAGGDPGNVVVRGVSIGALAAATLAERGIDPAAWLLVAPVRGETVVENFARREHGAWIARLVGPLFRPVTGCDLVAALGRMRAPLRVVSPEEDFLLGAGERDRMRAAVESAGGTWTDSSSGHEWTALAAHHVYGQEERDTLGAVVRDWPDGDARAAKTLARLESSIAGQFPPRSEPRRALARVARESSTADPRLVAAAALCSVDPRTAARMLRATRDARGELLDSLGFEEIVGHFGLADPGGALPWETVESWWHTLIGLYVSDDLLGCPPGVDQVLALARLSECEAERGRERMHRVSRVSGWSSTRWPCLELWRSIQSAGGLAREDLRRRAVRILLKAAVIPDRVVTTADGIVRLEAFEHGAWSEVALDWPPPCTGYAEDWSDECEYGEE